MIYFFSFKNYKSLFLVLLIASFGVFGLVSRVLAADATFPATNSTTITVTDELGAPLTSATVTFTCTENAGTTYTNTTNGSGQITVANSVLQASYNCHEPTMGNPDSVDITVTKSGFVTYSNSYANSWHDHSDDTFSISTVQYALKITATREGDVAALTGATVSAGTGTPVGCTEGGAGIYYCALPYTQDGGTNDITIAKTNYVTNTSYSTPNRASAAAAQSTVTASGVKFSLKVTVTEEGDSAALTGATVTAGTGPVTCSDLASNGTYYCLLPIDQDGGSHDITITKNGYVTNTSYSTADRSTAADSQTAVTASGVMFQVRINVADELENSTTGNTVTFNGSSATAIVSSAYYFAQTGLDKAVVISKNGFVPNATTNTGLGHVSATASGQTVITMGNYDVVSSSIAANVTTTIKGFQYLLKSTSLKTELGLSQITDLADSSGFVASGSASADVTITAVTDTTIQASAVKDNVIYIAVTGNGGANDSLTVQLQTVTADGGTANAATLVKATLTDTSNYISTGSAQKTFGIGEATGDIQTAAGFKYPLKVVVADELNNSINVSALTTLTYDSTAVYYSTSATAYFGNIGSNKVAVINKNGFVPNATTNAGLGNVSTNQTGQTTITLDTSATHAAAIAAGSTNTIKGLQYIIKSTVLKTELGGAVTNIASGSEMTGSGMPSADVTIAPTSGITLVATAVDSSNVIYIAATGSGGGTNALTVQLQTVTADGGTANAAALVKATVTDTNNYINAGTAQKTFGIGEATGDIQTAAGFKYPLKVVVTDELGTAINITDLDTATYGGTAVYKNDGANTAYFAATGTSATLALQKDGYLNAATNNTGLTAVTTNQGTQTVITLGIADIYTSAITAGATPTVKGMQFSQLVIMQDELGNYFTPTTVTAGSGPTSCTISTHTAYCAVPVAQDSNQVVTIAKDGYVTNTSGRTVDRTSGGSGQQSIYVSNIKYSHKVTVTREGDGSALSGATSVITGGVTCTESGTSGIYYCAVPLGSDGTSIAVTAAGYETNSSVSTSDRTAALESQGTETVSSVKFQLKVIVTDELGVALPISGLSVITFNGSAPTYASTTVAAAYWAITPAAPGTLIIRKDGYVDAGTINTGFTNITTSASNGQTLITMNNGVAKTDATADGASVSAQGLMFAQKVTVTRSGDGYVVNGASVSAGINSNGTGGTTCAENASSGDYYCALPLANSYNKTSVAAAGYVTQEVTFTARSLVTSTQRALTALLGAQHDNSSVTPAVSSQTPVDNASGVAVTVQPTISFNEAMNAGTLTGITVQLRKYSDDSQVNATVLYNSSTNTVTIAPTASLANNTRYYLYVSGAKDTAGNTITDYTTKASQDFTTAVDTTTLVVTGINTIANPNGSTGYATANGTYADGWAWTFNITASSTQTQFQLKFSDFTSGNNTISVATSSSAGIIRYCSTSATTYNCSSNAEGSGSWKVIQTANTYGDTITIPYASDLDTATPGNQVQIKVQMKVPGGSAGGSYSGSYGVQTSTLPPG